MDILADILDPFKNSAHKKDYGCSYSDLLKLFQTAESNISHQKMSLIRFSIIVLDGLVQYLDEHVTSDVTRQVARINSK